ncbi:SGT1 protein-domain-containing protein [Dunaliella salina]|uniref:SGT1 protein-domain-containing protein n=1 Tax=Dunaliella salina TaxID=3046 RepID=A0ABQ7GBM4_DUNSA|nr:SGT1 protein-domain-containing protein [Dunaliella salina]|eukprot:KAF5832013.1 SGT1 protein-domain-containing protein [Dunaliella salina]
MKAAARMRHFPPSKPRTAMLVTTNRCQYAQLAQQPFAPPRGWRLPPPDHPDLAPAERGLKITAGFEILMARSDRVPKAPAASVPEPQQNGQACANGDASCTNLGADTPGSGITTEAQLQGLPTWAPYKASLEQMGYFQGELPGSSRYKELLSAAISNFVTSPGFAKGAAAVLGPAEELQQLLDRVGSTAEAAAVASDDGAYLHQNVDCSAVEAEDSDTWMEARGAVVEQELAKRQAEMESGPMGHGQKGSKKRGPKHVAADDEAAGIDAGEVAERIKGFVEAMSGLEGAELPPSDAEVSFNPAAFAHELEQVLGVSLGGDSGRQRTAAAAGQAAGAAHDGADDNEEDDWDESTEEGSSFFSDDDGAGLDTEEDDEGGSDEEADGCQGESKEGSVAVHGGEVKESRPGMGFPSGAGDSGVGSSSYGHAWGARGGAAGAGSPHVGSSGDGHALSAATSAAASAVPKDVAAWDGKGRSRGRRRLDGPRVGDPAVAAADRPQQNSCCGKTAAAKAAAVEEPQQPPLPPRLQRLQDLWEVRTATDSDDNDDEGRLTRSRRQWQRGGDEEEEEDEEDALSIGGHSGSERGSSDGELDGVGGSQAPEDGSDGEAGFMEAYAAELEAQLRGTTLDASFERGAAPAQAGPSLDSRSRSDKPAGAGAEPGLASTAASVQQRAGIRGEGSGEDEALQPVDLDLNLVRNLVRSVASQQGFAGPGTNLASLLGLELPQSLQPEDADGGSG